MVSIRMADQWIADFLGLIHLNVRDTQSRYSFMSVGQIPPTHSILRSTGDFVGHTTRKDLGNGLDIVRVAFALLLVKPLFQPIKT